MAHWKNPGSLFVLVAGLCPFLALSQGLPWTATDATGSIPVFTGKTTGLGGTFNFQMVGLDPTSLNSNSTTTIDVAIVPLIFTFSDGTTLDASKLDSTCSAAGTALDLTVASPLFKDFNFSAGPTVVGSTQYMDFFRRTNFWAYTRPSGINPNYRLRLNAIPQPAQTIAVPAAMGSAAGATCGKLGKVDFGWLRGQLGPGPLYTSVTASGVVGPTKLLLYLGYNVVAKDSSGCCTVGYHWSFQEPATQHQQTYAFADFDTSGSFTNGDISALTHELGEWLDDPFVDNQNRTPPWGHVGQVPNSCESVMEVGDPLSATDITMSTSSGYTYHLQELAFASYFFSPFGFDGTFSPGVNGWFSSNGTFKSYASACGDTPIVTVTPGSLNFPPRTAGTTSSTGTVTLSNTGGVDLTNLTMSIQGANAGDFSFVNGCTSTVPPKGQCQVAVRFSPTAAGARSASLQFAANNLTLDTYSKSAVALQGTGILADFNNQQLLNGNTSGCPAPPATPVTSFTPAADHMIYLIFNVTVANGGATVSHDWLAPDGTVIPGVSFAYQGNGTRCFQDNPLLLDNRPPSQYGHWMARAFYNGTLLFQIPFTMTDPLYTSLAIGKPTFESQSTTVVAGGPLRPSFLAVDGSLDGRYPNVTHNQDPNSSAYWYVDLGTDHQIRAIEVWGRTDCCNDRLNGAKVMVYSNLQDPTSLAQPVFTATIGPLPAPTGNSQLVAAYKAGTGFPAPDGVTGRYVKVQINNGEGILSLAEVQVFGTAPAPTLSPAGAPLGSGDFPVTISSDTVSLLGATAVFTWHSVNTFSVPLATQAMGNKLIATIPTALLNNGPNSNTDITVTLPSGVGLAPAPFNVHVPTRITSLTPSSAQAGTSFVNVAINGLIYQSDTQAQWTSSSGVTTQLPIQFVDARNISVFLTSDLLLTPGTGQITVNNPGLLPSAPASFTITAPTTISSLSPSSIPAGSPTFTMTITGTAFVPGAVAEWSTGTTTDLATQFVSATSLTATVPASLLTTARSLTVEVRNPNVLSSNAVPFTVTPALGITSLSPPAALAGGPAVPLTVTGTGFVAGNNILWNGVSQTTQFVNATTLTTTIAANLLTAPGTGQVTVCCDSQLHATGAVPFSILLFTPSTLNLGFTGSQAAFGIDTPGAWSIAAPGVPWLHYTGPATGTGKTTIVFSVDDNISFAPHSANFTISGLTYTVRQLPAPFQSLPFYSTGTGGGAVLPNGTADPFYKLAARTDGQTDTNAYVTQPAGWVANDAGSVWIGRTPNEAAGGVAGTYTYRTTLDLTSYDATTATLTGKWAADDNAVVKINGIQVDQTPAVGYTQLTQFTWSGFQPGLNTIDFVVSNSGGASGLRVLVQGATALPKNGLSVFSTGMGAEGTVDPNYTLIARDDGSASTTAFVPPTANLPGTWLANDANSKWVSIGALTNAVGGNYTYRTSFNLTGLDTSTAFIRGQFAADDGGAIQLNGVPVSAVASNGFGSFTPFEITSGFKTGLNTLDFVVTNIGSNANPTGLRVWIQQALADPPAADMTLSSAGGGDNFFYPGEHRATFTLTAKNSGGLPTAAPVMVSLTAPAGTTNVTLASPAWSCTGLTCTRFDALPPGASYPPITVMFDIPATGLTLVAWSATVSGGGETNTTNDSALGSWALGKAPVPTVAIDVPAANATLSGTVAISGWALESASAVGPNAISSVTVLVDNAQVGTAVYGGARADVCVALANRLGCPNVGWTFNLNTTALAVGGHTLKVVATDSDSNSGFATVAFTTAAAPTVTIDAPAANATVSGVVAVSGWALDNATSVGTAIGSVQVKVDGVLAGNATYGSSRPDVCAAFPGRPGCPNVGYVYQLNTGTLTVGPHTITVTAIDTDGTPDSGTASVTVNVSAVLPTLTIDAPVAGSVVSGTVKVSGWALDNATGVGTAISTVAVKVDGRSVGNATYGISRPDVCAAFPGRPGCPNVGYSISIDTSTLGAGPHTISVTATDSDGTPDAATASVNVTVSAAPPAVFIDSPSPGAVLSGTVTVSGWALDNASFIGTPISTVQVKVDGTVVGNATYGTNRADVCGVFPNRFGCPNVGFTFALNTAGLSNGTHMLTATATDSDLTPDSNSWSVSFQVGALPTITIDAPVANAVLPAGTVTVSGWAIDSATQVGTAIGSVQVKVDGNSVGNATYGISRPDVCAAYPGRPNCPNVGYSFALNTSALLVGAHTITVTATDTDGTPDSNSATVAVTVSAVPPTVNIDAPVAGSVLTGTATISGWAIDNASAVGTAISSVVVKVDGSVVGNATYGGSRPDVCAAFSGRPGCPNVGFTFALTTSTLGPGMHTITVSATDSDGAPDLGTASVNVAVSAAATAPAVFIDSPTAGASVAGIVNVTGWAIDNPSAPGTPIGTLQVKVDGAVVGNATYGTSRPDVCSAYPGRPNCPNVGFIFGLNTGTLTPGTHLLTVTATDTDGTPDSGSWSVSFQVVALPAVFIDSPVAGTTIAGTVNVTGWAVDNAVVAGTQISQVQVKVDGAVVGNATYGSNRADVCNALPGRPGCPNVGFTFALNTASLSGGAHTITVTATDSDGTPDVGSASVTVNH